MHHLRREARVHEVQLARHQGGKAPIEGGGVGQDLARAFLEGDEQAGLAALARGVREALQREHRLARARAALEQGGAPARQPAPAHRVETFDAGGSLEQGLQPHTQH